ncbi:WASH complex subunit 2 isoform X2 [Megalops cyprinoides]|uniref:WASH complex subunit 2 isoform X2 n=1 Tax=Megalops cyprinoides TaxID=118141 RepID=UPI001863F6F3|nr:WASH complex subunit 2 isoform X2 [Megalops cyprinoides]
MSGLSTTLTNGPSEKNGEGEQIWERPWSLEEIRKTSANWSLAADSGLFLFLQDFSQRMLSKTHEIEKQLDGLIRDTKSTDCCLHTVFNDFLMLSNTQFIENRVYDEEVDEPVSKPEAAEKQPEQEKTREQKEAELIPKVQEAVNYGLSVLESAFEQLDIKAGNSDSEDEEATDRVEPILEPKDLYVDRPLPYLIGSQSFMEQDDVGLGDLSSEEMSIDSDRDSVIDSEENKDEDQSDDFDQDERQGSIKKKSSITSDEDEEEEDEEEDSDIFGESDKDDNEDRKSSRGPPSFADELAARIKGETASRPEEDRTSLTSATSAAKKKSKGKKDTKPVKTQAPPDDNEMFNPPPMEDEDFSPFGGKGGLFSGGKGLFDDDDEGDLFSDAPKPEDTSSKTAAVKETVSSKHSKKPAGAASIFPESSLFDSSTNGLESLESRQNEGSVRPKAQAAPKQATTGGLFDDDDDDDFFSGSTLKKSASAGLEKPKQKKAVDLFGGDEDDDDEEGDIFRGKSSTLPPQPKKDVEEEEVAPIPEKKMPAGAISMFGPGTKNILVEGLKRRQASTSEESEKSEESVPAPEAVKPSPKPAAKSQTRGLFSDDEDTQIFPSAGKSQPKTEPAVQSKPNKAPLSIFDDEEEEDLFVSAPPKSKAKSPSLQPASTPVSSSLFSDDEDQWMSTKPSETKPEVKATGMKASNSAPSRLPGVKTPQKDSLFDDDDDDDDLFTATKESSKKKPQRVSLLFEEEDEDDEEKGSLFGFKPNTSSTAAEVKTSTTGSPAPTPKGGEKVGDKQGPPPVEKPLIENLQAESVEPKKKPPGAVSLFGGIDVLGEKQDGAKTKSLLDDPDEDDFPYKDSPPPMEQETKPKKNILSLFEDDEEDETLPTTVSTQPVAKNTLKVQEQRSRTKSTGVFQDEELLFSQKQQKDNDPDVDLFASSGKHESDPPRSVKPAAPTLFGDDDEDDLFSSAKPKSPPKVAEKPRNEDTSVKPASAPLSADTEASMTINPASLLPGAILRIPGTVSVIPGLSPPSPSSSTTVLGQPPSPAAAVSEPQTTREGGVSFDTPAQVTTLQSANKGRAKGAGRRRPQTRAARHLAAQLSDELKDEGQEEAGPSTATPSSHPPPTATSAPAPATTPAPAPSKASALRLPVSNPADSAPSEGAKPKRPPVVANDDLFGSDDLFTPVSKQTPSPKPKAKSPKEVLKGGQKKQAAPSIFDDHEEDLFQVVKQKPAKKAKAVPFLDDEDDDIFGAGKSSAKKEAKAEANSAKQNIFQDEVVENKDKAPKKQKQKEKVLDASLFDDNVDIFADLTATTKPNEKKTKKKVETKSIFDDDMDDIFSSSTIKPVVKSSSKSKKSPPTQDSSATEDKSHSIFDDPLNALGGN